VTSPGTVTLLFTDLVRSTELLAELGDDRAEQVRRAHFALIRDTVANRGGEIVKNLGDGLMVVFASAVEAVRCAIAMQQAVDRHNRAPGAYQLDVRIGLHVGEPMLDEGDYFGTPVVVAQRLCRSAEGGQILVSDLVRQLVGNRGDTTFAAFGSLVLKGLPAEVPTSQVLWAETSGPRVPLPQALSRAHADAFVGRLDEMTWLRSIWRDVLLGRGRFALLSGEPGVGKSRLAEELARTVWHEGATVLSGRCDEEALAPYQPFVEALRHYVVSCPLVELEVRVAAHAVELSRLVPELATRLPRVMAGLSDADPDAERYLLFDAVASVLAAAATASPMLLLVEDLQWADKPTLLLLGHILRAAETVPILVLGSYRHTDLPPASALVDALGAIEREHHVERLRLLGLGPDDVSALVGGRVRAAISQEVTAAIYEQTDGNPFFTTELVRHLEEIGALGGAWPVQVEIPEGVRDIIGRRISRLSDDANRVITVASVVGRTFELPHLRGLAGLDPPTLVDVLEEVLRAGLVEEEVGGATGHYMFSHALIRDTIYAGLSAARRVWLHRTLAESLEEMHAGDHNAHLGEIAYHYLQSATGDTTRAVEYATRAGRRAAAMLAYEEAGRLYRMALQAIDLADKDDPECRLDLLLSLGAVQGRAGEKSASKETFLAAAAVARDLGDPEGFARAALGYGGGLEAHDVGGAVDALLVQLLDEALAALAPGDHALRPRLLGRLAVALYWDESQPASRRAELADEAVAIAERMGDRAVLAGALSSRRYGLWTPENVEDRMAAALRILDLARDRDPERTLQAHRWLALDLLEVGDGEGARREIAEHARLSGDAHQPVIDAYTLLLRGLEAILDGRWAETEALAAEAAAIGERLGLFTLGALASVQHQRVWRETGVWDRVEDHVRELDAWTLAASGYPPVTCSKAMILIDLGRADEARVVVEKLMPDAQFPDMPRDLAWLSASANLGEACAVLDDAPRSSAVFRVLSKYSGRVAMIGPPPVDCQGPVDIQLARMAMCMGDVDTALRHSQLAIEKATTLAAAPVLAYARLGHARVLRHRAQRGDAQAAAALIDEAAATADELGMVRLLQLASLESAK
jgi:class 3 adenylate cyclase